MWFTSNIPETGAGVGVVGEADTSQEQYGAPSWYSSSLWTRGLHPVECLSITVSPNMLTRLYWFSNDIPVHSISTGCPTLTQSRWAPSCHTWRGTNLTWQKWVGISILLIKMGRVGKTFLRGHSIKEKAWGLFHSCFAHWPESSGAAGNGVIGSVEARSTEGHFTLFRVLRKYTSRTAHTHSFCYLFLTQTQTLSKLVKNQRQKRTGTKTYDGHVAFQTSSLKSTSNFRPLGGSKSKL